MTTQKVTVVIDSASIDGKLFDRGSARIFPSGRIPDPADALLLEQAAARVTFTGGTPPQVDLFPNDLIGPQNDDSTPGWTYTIYYDGTPGNPQPWSFVLLSTDDSPQRLSGLAEVPVAVPSFLPSVAGRDRQLGDVPIADGSGQSSHWGSPGEASTGYPLEPVVSGTPSAGQALVASSPTAAGWHTLTAADVGADASGAAAAVLATSAQKSANLSDVASASTARANLGLGTAATHASTDFDASGAAATAQSNAIAASDAAGSAATAQANAEAYADTGKLAKSANLSDLASASTARTNLGLGSAATHAGTDFDAAGAAATAQSNAQSFATSAVGTETARAETAEALLAPLASPALTGNPTAPTQSAGNNSTKLATTAYADGSAGTAAAGKVSKAGDTMTGYLAPKVVTLTDGSSVAIDASLGNVFDWPLGAGSHTLAAPSNAVDGDLIVLRIGYSGSFTPLFNAIYDFNGSPPAWTATSGKEDEAAFRYRAASTKWRYQGSMLGFTS